MKTYSDTTGKKEKQSLLLKLQLCANMYFEVTVKVTKVGTKDELK